MATARDARGKHKACACDARLADAVPLRTALPRHEPLRSLASCGACNYSRLSAVSYFSETTEHAMRSGLLRNVDEASVNSDCAARAPASVISVGPASLVKV